MSTWLIQACKEEVLRLTVKLGISDRSLEHSWVAKKSGLFFISKLISGEKANDPN